MIIPIGHEKDTVRRLPWVTFGIMIACAGMLLLSDTGLLGDGEYGRFGLVPGDPSLTGWITHMFMHAGILHLLGNLLILYLAGPFLEDVWGRPLFLVFYLASGLFAACAFMVRAPDAMLPLVGASGAIAGVMGAFLIRYWNTEIRFFYIFGILIRGTFDAPAWMMLPLWFCEQLAMAVVADTGSGVAYWAHIGGFIFGVGFAALMAKYNIEKRYLDRRLLEKTETAVVSNPLVEQALAARENGDLAGAYELLDARVRSGPASGDASLALWSLAGELGRTAEAAPVLLALVELELRSGEHELATDHWLELQNHAPDQPVRTEILIRIGQTLIREERTDEGLAALRQALLQGGSNMNPSTALRIARAAEPIDPDLARGAARIALNHPDIQAAEQRQALALTEVHQP